MQGHLSNSLFLAEFHVKSSESPVLESVNVCGIGTTNCTAPMGTDGVSGRNADQVPACPGYGQLVSILGVQSAPFGYLAALDKHQIPTEQSNLLFPTLSLSLLLPLSFL